MLIKTLSILAVSLFVGCAGMSGMPEPPEIEFQYATFTNNQGALVCVRYPIQSYDPYKIGKGVVVANKECNGMNGLALRDFQRALNWVDDVKAWARQRQTSAPLN